MGYSTRPTTAQDGACLAKVIYILHAVAVNGVVPVWAARTVYEVQQLCPLTNDRMN